MRKNLDPFNEHTDEELWNALEEVSDLLHHGCDVYVRVFRASLSWELVGAHGSLFDTSGSIHELGGCRVCIDDGNPK